VRHAPKSLAQQPQLSLASWVSALASGSPCFCCGSPLCTSPVEVVFGYSFAPSLTCPVCGAGIVDETAVVVVAALGDREPDLVAA
jgi:hypothetical protein